jgi:hypothetical protein
LHVRIRTTANALGSLLHYEIRNLTWLRPKLKACT